MALAYFTVNGGDERRFGLLSGDRMVDIARSGGPESLSMALQMPAAELGAALSAVEHGPHVDMALTEVKFTAPIDRQEVWAAGNRRPG